MSESTRRKRSIAETFSGLSTKTKRTIAGVAGGLTAAAAATALVLSTMTAAAAAQRLIVNNASYPEGTTVIVDDSTANSFRSYPTTASYDTTNYAGRLWADKTVYAPADGDELGSTVLLDLVDTTNDLDPNDNGAVTAGHYEVDKTDSGTFMTNISLLSSSLETELYEPVPLDIVMVLDTSGSMNTRNGYTDVTSAPTSVSADDPNDHNTVENGGSVYCILEDGVYKQIRATAVQNNVRYYYKVDGHDQNDRFYFTTEDNLDGTLYGDGSNPNYKYAKLYRRNASPTRISELRDATVEFLDTIADANTTLAHMGYSVDAMSQVSMINFEAQLRETKAWTDIDTYSFSNKATAYGDKDNKNSNSGIITAFTTYTTEDGIDGTTNVSNAEKIVSINDPAGGGGLNAKSSTAADYGLKLAQQVIDGNVKLASDYASNNKALTTDGVSTEPARANAQKVVIFFTDGNPKHQGGNAPKDFSGGIAQKAMSIAQELKEDGVLIYVVAMISSADPDDLEHNANIYLNGVSSNYTEAWATDGVDTTTNNNKAYGTDTPVSSIWTVDPSQWEKNEDDQQYFLVVGGETTLSDAFAQIAADITSGGGEDTISTGRDGNTGVVITDYLGDYMEFKGIDGILYGVDASQTKFYAPGTQGAYHELAQAQRDDRSATESVYTMSATVPSALLNPEEGKENVNLNSITIQVTRSTDPKVGDTVTIKVPPELIPSLRYEVSQQLDPNGTVKTTVTRTEADPLRIYYSVGPKATTLSNVISQLEDQALRDPDAINESDNQTTAYRDFVANAASDGHDDVYPLYNNLVPTSQNPSYNDPTPEGENPAAGTTRVDMTLSITNPFYFYVDEPLWVISSTGGFRKATQADYNDANTVYYVRERTFNLPEEGQQYGTETTQAVEWTGPKQLREDGYVYITEGTAKTNDINYTNVALSKGDGNHTNTAANYLVSVFDGVTKDSNDNYTAVMYLGNNGELDIPVYGTLAVIKDFTAETGYSLPDNATASFKITLKDKDGAPLTGEYPAIIRDDQGHPVDPVTHAVVNTAEAAGFTLSNGSTFTLRDNETLRVTGLPNNSTYQVTEDAAQGYQATVTNNNNSKEDFTRGEESKTAPAGGSQGGGA